MVRYLTSHAYQTCVHVQFPQNAYCFYHTEDPGFYSNKYTMYMQEKIPVGEML